VLKLSTQLAGSGHPVDSFKCYATACEGRYKLKLGIEDIWYDCPYAGGSVEPLYYGGKVQCQAGAADLVCLDAVEDTTWPVINTIEPNVGGPLTQITITGSNFLRTTSISVKVLSACTDLVVVSDTEITCTIPDKTHFATLDILSNAFSSDGISRTELTVVVYDGRGCTALFRDGFTLEMESTEAAQTWIETNLILFICLLVGFILIVAVIGILVWKCCCQKTEEEKREARMKKANRH
jgi:hypothetical protein